MGMETTGLCRTNQHQLFSCLCIALVIALPWIHVRDSLGIWDVSMGLELQHLARHVMAELLNLFSDVSQKFITGPSANHHDGVDTGHSSKYIAIAAPDRTE